MKFKLKLNKLTKVVPIIGIPAILFFVYFQYMTGPIMSRISTTSSQQLDRTIAIAMKDPSNILNTSLLYSLLPKKGEEKTFEGKLNELISIYKKHLVNDPKNTSIGYNLARVYKWGALYYRCRNPKLFREYSQKAIEKAKKTFEIDNTHWQSAELIATIYASFLDNSNNGRLWLNKAANARVK